MSYLTGVSLACAVRRALNHPWGRVAPPVLGSVVFATHALAQVFPPEIDLQSLRPENGGDGTVGAVIIGVAPEDNAGVSMDIIGDFNGDGIDDLVIGASEVDVGNQQDAGAAYVVFGRAGGFTPEVRLAELLPSNGGDGSEGIALLGRGDGAYTGYSVSAAGDVNGDGLMDVLIGAPEASPPNRIGAGVAYLVFGTEQPSPVLSLAALLPMNGGDGSQGVVFQGISANASTGLSVSEAGDINGDGFDDILIGAIRQNFAREDAGAAYLLFGRQEPFPGAFDLLRLLPNVGGDGSEGVVLLGADADDLTYLVSGGFDFNDDGLADFAVGAPVSDGGGAPGAQDGSVAVVYGNAAGFPSVFDLGRLLPERGGNGSLGIVIEGINNGDNLGLGTSAGDLDGDGSDDLVLGAREAAGTAGEAYLVLGGAGSVEPVFELQDLVPSRGTLITGPVESSDLMGQSLDGGSDLNGDGLDDVVIGAVRGDAAFIVFGRRTYPLNFGISELSTALEGDGTEGVVLNNANANDDLRIGTVRVATGGDVNADGRADALVSGVLANEDRGAVYVVYGRSP